MQKLKYLAASIIMIGGAMTCQQASASEFYKQITSAGPTLLNIISPSNSTAPAIGKYRIVHAFVATNTDSLPVTVTITKLDVATTGDNLVTKTVFIVPANSTHEISLPSGIGLLRTSATLYDNLEIELSTTSSSPVLDLTVDFKDD